jgi:hypothetical protein
LSLPSEHGKDKVRVEKIAKKTNKKKTADLSTGEVMALRPNQGDEKRRSGNYSLWKRRPPPCHLDRSAAQWRDLCVDAPSWKCFFDRSAAQWRDLQSSFPWFVRSLLSRANKL